MYRFARAARLYDGPDEVHRQSVARADPARLRGAGGRRADRARPDPPRGGARARSPTCSRRSPPTTRAVLLGVASLALALGVRRRCGSATAPRRAARPRAPKVDRFDGDRAFAELRRQVELGPRPAGSPQLAQARGAAQARAAARALSRPCPATGPAQRRRPDPRQEAGDRASPRTTTPRTCRASSAPTTARAAPPRCSSSRARCASTKRPKGAPPSCASCSSTARRPPTTTRDFLATGVRGSKAYARRHADELRALVLLDFVADKDLRDPARGGLGRASCGRGCGAAAKRVGRRRARSRTTPSGRGHRRPHAVHRARRARRST